METIAIKAITMHYRMYLLIGLAVSSGSTIFGMHVDENRKRELQQKIISQTLVSEFNDLNKQRLDGTLTAEQYMEQMSQVIKEARDSRIDIQSIIDKATCLVVLIKAVSRGSVEEVRFLLGLGVDPQPAMNQIFQTDIPSDAIIGLLIEHGANINAASPEIFNGATQLNLLATHPSTQTFLPLLQLLLAHGANPNAVDNDKATPLMSLMQSKKNLKQDDIKQAIMLLVAAGTDIGMADKDGRTVFDYARDSKQLNLLREALEAYSNQHTTAVRPLIYNGTPLPPDLVEVTLDYLFALPRELYSPFAKTLSDMYQHIDVLLKTELSANVHDQSLRARTVLIQAREKDEMLQKMVKDGAPENEQLKVRQEIDTLLDEYEKMARAFNEEMLQEEPTEPKAREEKVRSLDEDEPEEQVAPAVMPAVPVVPVAPLSEAAIAEQERVAQKEKREHMRQANEKRLQEQKKKEGQ